MVHLIRHRPVARLFVAGAYREGEQGPLLDRAVADLIRQRALILVHLGPLSPADIQEIARGHLRAGIDATFAGILHGRSEGNPFFAEELLRNWIEERVLVRHGTAYTLLPEATHSLPLSLTGAITQRVARLPADTIELLRIAAIVGRGFTASLLADVVGEDVEAVEERLLPAESGRLIREEGNGDFAFSHDKIRECLYREVRGHRRQRLHDTIGAALERRGEQGNPQLVADLAFHFGRGREPARAFRYALAAGRQAEQRYAWQDALAHYHTAARLLSADDPQLCTLQLQRGQVALPAGQEVEAAGFFEAAGNGLRTVFHGVCIMRPSTILPSLIMSASLIGLVDSTVMIAR